MTDNDVLDIFDYDSDDWMDWTDEQCGDPNEKYIFVDMQGFKISRNRFICKEFCLIDCDFTYHKFIKSPFNINKLAKYYQKRAKWLINNYHRIEYDHGNTSIIDLKQSLYSKLEKKVALVRGAEKVDWLKYMFRDCIDLECYNIEDLNFDFNNITKYYDACAYHKRFFF